MPALKGPSLPSAELATAFVNCEKRRDALIVGMAGMSAGYAKPSSESHQIECITSGLERRGHLPPRFVRSGVNEFLVGGNLTLMLASSPCFQRRNLELVFIEGWESCICGFLREEKPLLSKIKPYCLLTGT